MEIDFMGLYSKNPAPGYDPDAFMYSGIIASEESDVSLSLCTSSPMDEKIVFQDFLQKKTRKSPAENITSIVRNSAGKYDWENAQLGERSCPSLIGKPIISHSGFRFNRNDISTISRNTFELTTLTFPASSTVFRLTATPNLFPAQKDDRKMYATGYASFDDTRKSKHGYTPTVAMARKATLARFLEKRSHRLNQQIKPHLTGRSLNWSEACDTAFTKRNKKIKKKATCMKYEALM